HEPPRHVGPEPLARRRETRERAGPDGLADRRHHVPGAVVLELLWRRPLLVDVVALALPEGLVHLRARHVDGPDRPVVEAAAAARVLEHGQRLPTVVDQHLLAPEL